MIQELFIPALIVFACLAGMIASERRKIASEKAKLTSNECGSTARISSNSQRPASLLG